MLKLAALLLTVSCLAGASDFVSEASGLTRLGKYHIIAGDEEKKALFVRSDDGIAKVEVKGAKWDDMEALASINENSFYGMTSHSLTKKGKQKPEREQLIRFTVKGDKISAEQSWSLRNGILDFLSSAANDSIDINKARTGLPQEGGLNVEGLALSQNKLFFGLRSPLTKSGHAIILEANPEGKITGWKTVDLKGKGIRDLTADGVNLLILAGSTDDSDEAFALYQMTSSGSLSQTRYDGFSDLKRPEGILREKDGSLIVVQDFVEEDSQDFFVTLR